MGIKMKIAVLIPCYNKEFTKEFTIEKIKGEL